MKKSYSIIIYDTEGNQVSLTLFNSMSIDVAKRYARQVFEAFDIGLSFDLYDLSDTSNGDVSQGKLVLNYERR